LADSRNNNGIFKKVAVIELVLFELFILLSMEVYKYYINSDAPGLFSRIFLKELSKSFSFFYTGNLFWFVLFILSIISIYNIYRNLGRVSSAAVNILFFLSFILLAVLIFALLLPSFESLDSLTGNFIQLNARGSRILLLSVFALLKIFFTISLCVVSFSALKKFYVFRSIWLTIGIFAASILIIFVSIYTYKDDYERIQNNPVKFDAGVVLGAAVWGGNRPSPVLRERINKGFELYKSGLIKSIVLTGGGSPGEMTEAEVGATELVKKGVEEKNIYMETKSNSTLEQITYIDRNLYKKNNWNEIVLITDNFHLMRSKQMCSFFGIKAKTCASDTPLSSESTFYYSLKESFAIILFWFFGIG